METHPADQPLFKDERLALPKLLANNPNYFGTIAESDFPVVQPIKFNTAYEELTCVGLWPEKNLIEAVLMVKLPFGFGGDLCGPGTYEYVRFFIDWNDDGDFSDANEDLGVAQVNVHDIPQVVEHHLCYAVYQEFRPYLASCKEPYIVKLRAILSWAIVPTGPNFIPPWGDILECWVQIDPVQGRVLGIVSGPEAAKPDDAGKPKKDDQPKPRQVPEERLRFHDLLKSNPNYFGTQPLSEIQPIKPIKYDTTYEQLKCVGLYPERDLLEAVLEVKLPFGFGGDLCAPGTYEHVRFFIDWDGNGDFYGANEDIGVASVNVHDIPEVRRFHLCYAVAQGLNPLRATCQQPYIVKVRAILSWQDVPTGPDYIPVWGNVVECWVQVRPTERVPRRLIGEIDTPAADVCATPTLVATCVSSAGPLNAIVITGSAGGAPFNRYTITYSYGGTPPINTAVVYPNCGRPPAQTSSNVPVLGGVLGYLDVTLLPPGVTAFDVVLTVFDSGSGSISDSTSFKLRTTAVEITAAATVQALVAEDPFNLGSSTKLIKATNNPATSEPEQSIGGAFSVSGSAYLVGCDRIMTQFVLAHFSAPPAAPVPAFASAAGGTPLIAPVIYADTLAHPWQSRSACPPASPITPNTIENGNLVAHWGGIPCALPFPLFTPYSIPKVRPVPFWLSNSFNGRYVILLEVRDRLEASSTFPGSVALVDQVAVWIDNHLVEAAITSIGGLSGCGDLKLSDFVGTTCAVRGIAWDPPIDPTAPQQRPNDNFGAYSLGFQRNGVPAASGTIPEATPGVRVPNVWPGPLAVGADGVLANWDIVGDVDGGTGPLPLNSPKIVRGSRCAYVLTLSVSDTTHVGDSGNQHQKVALFALTIINDLS